MFSGSTANSTQASGVSGPSAPAKAMSVHAMYRAAYLCSCPSVPIDGETRFITHEKGCVWWGVTERRVDAGRRISVPSEAFSEELSPPGADKIDKKVNFSALERIGRELLLAIGEDPSRAGLKDTPARFARMWRDFIEYDPGTLDTAFASSSNNNLVLVGPMRVWSKCEHHLLPFWTDITIGVRPAGRILGLSKFARIAHKEAHRLQVQEQLVADVARNVARTIGTRDVAVLGRGSHLCMVARGIRSDGVMTNYSLDGDFTRNPLREEFLSFARQGAQQ